jgi:AraC-like DNA-binding protein
MAISEFKSTRKYELAKKNSQLNVHDITKSLGLSRVQLYRKLRSLTDHTPNELIHIIRLKYASRLLSLHSKSIAEVAYESGFSSPPYFTKCFKEQYNINPTDYLR